MRLSIAIVNWNTNDLLESCIRSIEKYHPTAAYEIIVVDNASEDFDYQKFSGQFPQVKFMANEENAGYARANNQALEASAGDYVLLLNPDTEVTENALEHLLRFMESHEGAAAAGCRLVRPTGEVEQSVRSFPAPGPIAWEFLGLSRLFPKSRTFGAYRMTYFDYDTEARVDQPMGSCLILSRRAIDKVGLMDEQFPIFFNEVDWLYRAKQTGYEVYFTPDATVIHHGAASTKQAGRRKMARESHDSLLRFYAKHYKGHVFAPVYYFTVMCIWVSRLIRS
ncbi:MAG: hypothetical protein A2Z18_04220 [Armatimonadetes bacterium RBG_16_58_9]|nr:MAG: hypothetical protein A2Z18_04220 [Armatimonadetes bacterium RBG_16_58_9]